MVNFDACEDAYNYWPFSQFRGASLLLLVLGAACCLSFLSILAWLRYQHRLASRSGFHEHRTRTLLFPLYTRLMWLGALATAVDALGNLFAPTRRAHTNTAVRSMLFGGVWALYHFVFEGVALLMLHPGVGRAATRKSAIHAGAWAAFTWIVQGMVSWRQGSSVSIALAVCWSGLLVLFYGALWLLPLKTLFRRPAVWPYARFWCLMRLWLCLSQVLRHYGLSFGFCMYLAGTAGFESPAVAVVVYYCLQRDVQWWLGVMHMGSVESGSQTAGESAGDGDGKSTRSGLDTLRRPLLGTSLAPSSARVLARQLDTPRPRGLIAPAGTGDSSATPSRPSVRRGVPILNFAFLRIDQPVRERGAGGGASGGGESRVQHGAQQVILGAGSACRVFRGTFRDRPVAIKMVFVPELTPEVLQRFHHEATLLAQLQHANVVEVLGVCVLPPAVCLVLELCEGGNLFDFLRQPSLDSHPLSLGRQLQLCWDAAAAVHFLHSRHPAVLHLDLKSLNFLLTREGRLKVADLELGREILRAEEGESDVVVAGSELTGFKVPETLYWLAPEIILGLPYNERADVYALALVVWEIWTRAVPYRSLEDSLVLAARNARFLADLGWKAGSYPLPPQLMPYSLADLRGRGKDKDAWSRRGSASVYSVSHGGGGINGAGRQRTDSVLSGSSVASSAAGAGAGAGVGAGSAASSRAPSPAVVVPSSRPRSPPSRSHRSVSASSRPRYEGEEEEMSTPSSAGSRAGERSEAASPVPVRPLSGPSSFFPPPPSHIASGSSMPPPSSMPRVGSPPPFSALPPSRAALVPPHHTHAPSASTQLHASVNLAAGGVGAAGVAGVAALALTHENLAALGGSGGMSHGSFTAAFAGPGVLDAQYEPDPVLLEWKRMHGVLRGWGGGGAGGGFVPPSLSSGSGATSNASSRSGSIIARSVADLGSWPSSAPPPVTAPITAAVAPTASAEAEAALEESFATTPAGYSRGGSPSSSSASHLLHPDSSPSCAPFASDLSPIPASVDASLLDSCAAPSGATSAATALAEGVPMPPPVLPHPSVPARYIAAASLDGRRVESYVQYDEAEIERSMSAPSRSSLSRASSVASGGAAEEAAVAAATAAAASAAADLHSNPVSPALSAASVASSERVPRLARLQLPNSASNKAARSRSRSRRRGAKTSDDRSARRVIADFSRVHVSRHEIQSQLTHLICIEHYRPTLPADMPDALAALLTRAWHPSPAARPTAAEFCTTVALLLDAIKAPSAAAHSSQSQAQAQQQQHNGAGVEPHPFRGSRDEAAPY